MTTTPATTTTVSTTRLLARAGARCALLKQLVNIPSSAGNTYLAGCTDPMYTDGSCPWKSDDFAEQEWVGLTRCDAVNETANEWAWAGCSVPSSAYTTLKRLGTCDCTDKATLFVAGQALLRHASIPSTVGGTISWVSGYAVTSAETTSTSTASSSFSETATAGSTATDSAASSTTYTTSTAAAAKQTAFGGSGSGSQSGSESHSGSENTSLSTGAKAGIAVGSIGAVLSVLAMAVVLFVYRRRKRGGQSEEPSSASSSHPAHSPSPPNGKGPESPTVMMDENDGMAPPAYPTYSGYKAELPAGDNAAINTYSTTPRLRSTPSMMSGPVSTPEMAGDSATINTVCTSPRLRSSPSTVLGPALTPEMAHSEFGDRRMSLVSELSSFDGAYRGSHTMVNQAGMTPIAELQG